VARHGEAGARLGPTAARRGWGSAWNRGAGSHAHARVLASQGRGVAVPCVGHGHPGHVTRCGGGGRRRLQGDLQRDGSLHKKRHGGRMGERGS
jgi:hypothetical protein